jgi:mono/diheme cytochrome c family protein
MFLFAGSIASVQTVTASLASDRNERGRRLYYQYCASCHGEDAMGNGPVAATMKTVPPSLKNLKGPDGKFPAIRVQNIIAGEVDVPAHGSREMPVWGRFFRQKRGDTAARLDVYALTKYLEAFQPK